MEQSAQRLDGVGLRGRLVVTVALDACEPKGDSTRIAGRVLDAVDGDLDHGDRLGPHRTRRTPHLQLLEPFSLPLQQRIGEALESLAHHHVAAGFAELANRVQGSEVQVRQQPGAPS